MQTSECTRTLSGTALHWYNKCGRNQWTQSSMSSAGRVQPDEFSQNKPKHEIQINWKIYTRISALNPFNLFIHAKHSIWRQQNCGIWKNNVCFLISDPDTIPVFRVNKNDRKQLVHREHVFNRHVVRDHLTYWRCSQFSVCRCPARIKTKFDTIMSVLNVQHNHEVVRAPRPYGALKKMKREMQLKQTNRNECCENSNRIKTLE